MNMKEKFEVWQKQLDALKALAMRSEALSECGYERLWLGWQSAKSSLSFDVPNDKAIAARVVRDFPELEWTRCEESYQIKYVGVSGDLEIELHHAETMPADKPVKITPLVFPIQLEASAPDEGSEFVDKIVPDPYGQAMDDKRDLEIERELEGK